MPRISDDEVQGVIDRYGYDCDCYDVIALGKDLLDARRELTEAETCFCEGGLAAESNSLDDCPYAVDASKWHWWTRGYAYKARLLRAIVAEDEVKRLREMLEDAGMEGGDPDECTKV